MTSAKNEIGFDHIGLATVLKRYRLTVPPNQREFSWTEKEVLTLFQDVANAMSSGDTDYFLGTIVTIPRGGPEMLEVVDGQQRLATTAIFLSAVRDYLRDTDPLVSETIERDFLIDVDLAMSDIVAVSSAL